MILRILWLNLLPYFAVLFTSAGANQNAVCPPVSGMTDYGNAWLTHGSDALSFDQAVSYCTSLGLTLATVAAQTDLDNYYSYIEIHQLKAWANVANPDKNSCYSPSDCDGKFRNDANNFVSSAHFPSGIYVGVVDNEECIALDLSGSRYVHAVNCNDLRVPICSSDCEESASACSPTPPSSVSTDLSLTKYYHISPTHQYTFDAAAQYCQGLGNFVLAKISNEQDFNNLENYIRVFSSEKHMIDLTNPTNSDCSDHLGCDQVLMDIEGNPIDTSYMSNVIFDLSTRTCVQFRLDNFGSDRVKIDGFSSCDKRYVICEYSCASSGEVDGGWSDWSASGSCSATCGGGYRTETRTCTNPAPSSGGTPCVGSSTRAVACQAANACPVCPPHPQSYSYEFGDRFFKVSDSAMASWEASKAYCESIGMGLVALDDVVNVAGLFAMDVDEIWVDAKHSTSSGDCVGDGASCALTSSLSLEDSNGGNVDFRYIPRFGANQADEGACMRYSQVNGGQLKDLGCDTSTREAVCVAICGVVTCPAFHPYAYSNGGSCCETNTDCSNTDTFAREGACCAGTSVSCTVSSGDCYDAVVDGQWGSWEDDSTCSVTCGNGVLTQKRACNNPSPANGGANCIGDETQTGTTPCNPATCPAPEWDDWSDWGECSKTCDYGTRKRRRTCLLADNSCSGQDTEIEYCTNSVCLNQEIGTYFKPYSMTNAAKDAFMSSSEAVDISDNLDAKILCAHKCLAKRANRFEFSVCNGFILEDKCYLGYQDPNWIWEQKEQNGADATIYFDIND